MRICKRGGFRRLQSRDEYRCRKCASSAVAVYNHEGETGDFLVAVCSQRHFAWLPRSRENARLISLSKAQGASIEHIARHYDDAAITKKGTRRRNKGGIELIGNHLRIWPGNESEMLLLTLFPDWMGDEIHGENQYSGDLPNELGRESSADLSPH